MTVRMHADQVDVDVLVVRRLVAEQFSRWGRVAAAGATLRSAPRWPPAPVCHSVPG
jgi:hypothetical protein